MSRLQKLLSLSRSRRTETALILGCVVLACVIGISGWRAATKLTQFIEVSKQGRYYAEIVEGLEFAIGNIVEAETQQRGYLLTADTAYLSMYDEALVALRESFDSLIKLSTSDKRLHPHILQIKALTDKRVELLSSGIHYYRTGHEKQAREVIYLGQPLARAIREQFAQLRPEYETALANTRKQVVAMRAAVVRSFVTTSALVAVVLSIMVVMVILEARLVRSLAERLQHAARHDELTGLPNRAYLNEWLARSIPAAKRAGEKLGLLYMDLNGFKQVNDTMGHQAGDEVLAEVSRKLENMARDSDFVARLGGDEFAVVMPRILDKAQMEAAAQRFSTLAVTRGPRTVGASVGAALYPDDADSAEGLMRVGDAAMYERKQARTRS